MILICIFIKLLCLYILVDIFLENKIVIFFFFESLRFVIECFRFDVLKEKNDF